LRLLLLLHISNINGHLIIQRFQSTQTCIVHTTINEVAKQYTGKTNKKEGKLENNKNVHVK